MAVANNVRAILKDIKVTKKGIVLSFEDVKLQGEELTDLASLIGGVVLLDVASPQMDLFEDEDVSEVEEDTTVDAPEEVQEAQPEEQEDLSEITFEQPPTFTDVLPITFSDDEVAQELGL